MNNFRKTDVIFWCLIWFAVMMMIAACGNAEVYKMPEVMDSYDVPEFVELHVYDSTSDESVEEESLHVGGVYTQSEVANVTTPAQRGEQRQLFDTVPPWEGAWPYSIPAYYGDGSACTQEEADMTAWWMRGEGATDDTIRWMLKTYSKETTCDNTVHRLDYSSRDDSWGVCQLNRRSGHFLEGGILEGYDYTRFADDFLYNVEACTELWKVCGRGPWTKPYWCSTPEELR